MASYCPICGKYIGYEPFCSDCGDVSGCSHEEYRLHDRQYYIEKQIKIFDKVIVEPKISKEI